MADVANSIFTDLKNDMRTRVFLCPADDYQEDSLRTLTASDGIELLTDNTCCLARSRHFVMLTPATVNMPVRRQEAYIQNDY